MIANQISFFQNYSYLQIKKKKKKKWTNKHLFSPIESKEKKLGNFGNSFPRFINFVSGIIFAGEKWKLRAEIGVTECFIWQECKCSCRITVSTIRASEWYAWSIEYVANQRCRTMWSNENQRPDRNRRSIFRPRNTCCPSRKGERDVYKISTRYVTIGD